MTIGALTALPVVGDLVKTGLPVLGDIVKAVAPLLQPFADALAKQIAGKEEAPPSKTIEFPMEKDAGTLTISFKQ
ncbi:hypothetical protein BLL37_01725 [Pseudomonas azotoformans]|uniref:Uncharacterized protein n=1 Tax=Pseudomonas azotoformans TaxID=47878 RepID=A0A1V2JSE7_PSEAZ|nr:hypothetical protein [Pseudomonas azotoformans]OIN44884.1 hypothetical protein BFL39_27530 [Pseudomonas azotoformans]ONH48104.1 hypothetical protein BLL37_01725 [Pseudomonas azotoformans]SDN86300.1 hypothetical protein SAMN04489799_3051 [Pseudomonas azotoformans]